MDLTDKIDLEGWYLEEDNIADKQINDYIKNTADYILQEITPKVAIDFAKYCSSWDWCLVQEGYWMNPDYPSKTSEQLFEEFLKDYNYEG